MDLALNKVGSPGHIVVSDAEILTESTTAALIVIFTPLSVPIKLVSELITLILYALPVAALQGKVQLNVSILATLTNAPIVTGLVKLPAASDSCALKILPGLKSPMLVNDTFILVQAQNGLPVTGSVVIVCDLIEVNDNKKTVKKANDLIRLKTIFIIPVSINCLAKLDKKTLDKFNRVVDFFFFCWKTRVLSVRA